MPGEWAAQHASLNPAASKSSYVDPYGYKELTSNAISWWLKLKGDYLKSLQPGIGVVSDIAACGSAVAISNRICTNFAILGFIFGDLGAKIDGVPTEYKRYSTLIRRRSLTPYASLYGPVSVKRGDLVLVKDTSGVSMYVLVWFFEPRNSRVLRLGSFCNLRSLRAEKMHVAAGLGTQDGISCIAAPDWDEEVMKISRTNQRDGRGYRDRCAPFYVEFVLVPLISIARRCIDDHSLCDGVCSSGVNGRTDTVVKVAKATFHVGSEAATMLGLRWKKIRVHE
ncbi:hypothetical protein C8R44DRAFT_863002 [Mycena epipterygia]|nr:hypothetical protein C8R44DRAFT_863002 [Mycena epipterygia]